MKKYLKVYLKVSLITWMAYLLIWIMTMFVHFELIHPFACLLKIPSEDNEYRGMILTVYLLILTFKIIATKNWVDYLNEDVKTA